ncbi:DUF724 domain-containing protein 3 [Abeliophyllum distichum]|uniref:DUF724 domain-containing protein 3 n=1 Tax=Abeliophyllum distichum TaxID=126358 RepID=A0ABD1RTK7_9LAMI
MPRKYLFPEGSLIEVKTDEEGFKDVYFLATCLLADDNESDLLREFVDLKFVRPAPPPLEIVEGFAVNDVVDAFYRDGWWIGVVKKVEEGSRFVVTFQNPPDELQFGISDLRAHWEWIDGLWVLPVHPSKAALMFDVGRKVEVSIEEENCLNAWFPATILEIVTVGSFVVELWRPKVGNEPQPLTVTVDPIHVRPTQPRLKDKKYVLLEKIDAFFDGGWWSGDITKELEDGRYVIFVKQTEKYREFHQSEIRPHLEWKDSKWFASSKDVLIPSSDDEQQGGHICANTTTVAVPVGSLGNGKENTEEKMSHSLNSKKNQMGQLTPFDQKPSNVTTSLTKRRHRLPSDSLDDLSLPLKKLKEGNLVAAASLAPQQQNTLITSSKTMLRGSASPISENTSISSAKQPVPGDLSNNPYGWQGIGKQQKVEDNPTSGSMKKRGRTQELQVESPESVVGGLATGKGSSICKRDRQSHDKESLKLVSEQEQQSNDSTVQRIKESKQPETEESSHRRKRGRPPKTPIKSHQTQVTGNAQKGDAVADEMVIKDCVANEVGLHTTAEVEMTGMEGFLYNQESTMHDNINGLPKQKNRSVSMMKKTHKKVSDEKAIERSLNPNEKHSSKRGRRRATDEKSASQVQDSLDVPGSKTTESNHVVNELKNVIARVPSREFDDEPLSKWIEEMQAPTSVDGSRVSLMRTAEQFVETAKTQKEIAMLTNGSERQKESGMQIPTSGDKGSIVQSEQQSLPFVKNAMLWNAIESMDVFRRIPQKPHFQPLLHTKESSREGLAIGLMVTFSSVVEKASHLQLNDPKIISDDILENVADLERYGFDIQAVRDRVTGLLSVKDRQEKLLGQVEEISCQIVGHNLERNHMDEEIDEIKKQIRNLQEKLSLAESAKETKDLVIASIKSKLLEIKENIATAVCDFEGLAATPL